MLTRERVAKRLHYLHSKRHVLLRARRMWRADRRRAAVAKTQAKYEAVCAEIDTWEMWEYRVWPGPYYARLQAECDAILGGA